ncbi:MAG TPA: dihydrolipoamide acetyltransferase family protein [Hydrogenophaga sp.]|uniref:dihydrolipoamide acetyltransferase family protein n=1 Tax=Hydrogenophaga sp. TaxID=1904254 RepID=UPI002C710D24|nr:dihydrolipoamide acetyltransferase family protein [Hydrogenophaga sp.]HMN91808.1 dihydrolipoamide acetyltransferase family protein [Hydrogenophaga sp.]HMP10721.1 dihydrolipoamide acetyltransferase family protein [Hydrogenophaga sp.]
MAEFTMPALGADMETGQVVQWLVKAGDRVHSGDVVAVVETHKGAIDVECFLEGVIDDLVPLGQTLPVGAVLARVRQPGDAGAPATAPPAGPVAPVSPQTADAQDARPAPEPVARRAPPPSRGADRVRVSPAARWLAAQAGLDTAALRGTGADGAVIRADVEQAMTERVSPAAARRPVGFDPAQMRQAIATAMARSKREIPHYYLDETIDVGSALSWIEAYNRERPPAERLLPAVLLLKAVAVGLRAVPQLNGFCVDGRLVASEEIHIGWAVALRGGGLIAPAIRHADRQSLPQLMTALRDLVQRARAGGLRSSELTDPTITVTSLGDRGAERVQGVIYPPQVAIVGFGRVADRPWVVDGALVVRPLVQCSLAADHRTSDGHLGGQLLAAVAQALQKPEQL